MIDDPSSKSQVLSFLRKRIILAGVLLAGLAGAIVYVKWPAIDFHFAPELSGTYVAGPIVEDPVSPPDSGGSEESIRFLVIGDTGTGCTGQKTVAATMARVAKEKNAAFVLMVGDNFYPSGVGSVDDRQFHNKFERIYRSRLRKIPFYVALGNHDHKGDVEAQIAYSGISERWNMPARYYTFSKVMPGGKMIQFFMLDTDPIVNGKPETESQIVWLEESLAASNAHWKIVAGHHPLRSGGRPSTSTRELRKVLLPVFRVHPVDLYLSGHDHYLELGQADDGIHYAISGAGSHTQKKVVKHDRAVFAAREIGFLAVRADEETLALEFIGRIGEPLFRKAIRR